MKYASLIIAFGVIISTAALAERKKAVDLPECQAIVKQCEAPNFGYQLREHSSGKGLWVDCIGKRAQGQDVKSNDGKSQIAATPEQAKTCLKAAKKLRGK